MPPGLYGRAVPGTPGCYNQGRNRICAHEFLQGRFPKGSRSKSRVAPAGAVFAEVVHRPLLRYRIRRRKGSAPGQLGLVLRRLDQNGQILSALRPEVDLQLPGKALGCGADQLPVGGQGLCYGQQAEAALYGMLCRRPARKRSCLWAASRQRTSPVRSARACRAIAAAEFPEGMAPS